MKNEKKNNIKINQSILNRWSPRAFSNEKLLQEDIDSLFEAARWAPSSMNEQPWQFLYAERGSESYEKILNSLAEMNQLWAKEAPLLIVSLAKKNFERNGRTNTHSRYDLGAAVANLSIQATDMNLFLHQMGGFSAEKLIENLDLDESLDPVVILAVGKLGDKENLTEMLLERENAPRQRKPLNAIATKI